MSNSRFKPKRSNVLVQPGASSPAPHAQLFTANKDVEDMHRRVGLEQAEPVLNDFEPHAPIVGASAASYASGQTADVPLSLIEEHELNARVFYSAEEIDAMALSLRENGQDVAAKGYVDGDRVVLVDGQKRLRGARAGGLKTLRVEFRKKPSSSLEVYLESRRINVERSTQSALDDAQRFRKLLDSGLVESQIALAQLLKLSETTISQTLAVNSIPSRIIMQMKDKPNTCSPRMAYHVAQIFLDGRKNGIEIEKLEQTAAEVVVEIAEKEMTTKQAQALIASRLAGPRKRATPTSENINYGEAKGVLKMFPSKGEIALNVKELTPEQFQELSVRIKEFFDQQKGVKK